METGIYIDVNDRLQTFGYTREEVIGHKAEDLIWAPGDRQNLIEIFLKEGKIENREFVYRAKSGKAITLLFSVVPIEINGKHYALASGCDITKVKQLENKVVPKELKNLNLILESIYPLLLADAVKEDKITILETADIAFT